MKRKILTLTVAAAALLAGCSSGGSRLPAYEPPTTTWQAPAAPRPKPAAPVADHPPALVLAWRDLAPSDRRDICDWVALDGASHVGREFAAITDGVTAPQAAAFFTDNC